MCMHLSMTVSAVLRRRRPRPSCGLARGRAICVCLSVHTYIHRRAASARADCHVRRVYVCVRVCAWRGETPTRNAAECWQSAAGRHAGDTGDTLSGRRRAAGPLIPLPPPTRAGSRRGRRQRRCQRWNSRQPREAS